MPMELILNLKKVCVLLKCLQFLKKSVLKLLDRTVSYFYAVGNQLFAVFTDCHEFRLEVIQHTMKH